MSPRDEVYVRGNKACYSIRKILSHYFYVIIDKRDQAIVTDLTCILTQFGDD